MEVGTTGSTEASRSERVQRTTIAFLILVAACLLTRVWVLVEYQNLQGDVMIQQIPNPLGGHPVELQIHRTANDTTDREWAERAVRTVLEFQQVMEGK